MDTGDHVGAGQRQQIIIPLYIVYVILKPLPTEGRFVESVALDHRAHGAIHDQDALRKQGFEELELRYGHHIEIIPYWGVDGGKLRSRADHCPGLTDTFAVHYG